MECKSVNTWHNDRVYTIAELSVCLQMDLVFSSQHYYSQALSEGKEVIGYQNPVIIIIMQSHQP